MGSHERKPRKEIVHLNSDSLHGLPTIRKEDFKRFSFFVTFVAMTILEAIKQANTAAGIKTFAFANITEFNSFVDSFRGLDLPVNLVVPVTVNSTLTQPRTQDSAVISGFVMTRLNEDTNDYRSIELEDKYINPMRVLAKKFLIELIKSDIYNEQNQSPPTASIVPEYQWLAVHLFGVSYRAVIPLKAKVC